MEEYIHRLHNLYKKVDKRNALAGKYVLAITIYVGNVVRSLEIALNTSNRSETGKMLFPKRGLITQLKLMYMRMLIDCCIEVYAALLVKDKEHYFNNFLAGKPTNHIKLSGQPLSGTFLRNELDKEYRGIQEIYKECCSWIHPSKAAVIRVGKYKGSGEYIGYRDRTYKKMKVEQLDIDVDFLYCQNILLSLLDKLYKTFVVPNFQIQKGK